MHERCSVPCTHRDAAGYLSYSCAIFISLSVSQQSWQVQVSDLHSAWQWSDGCHCSRSESFRFGLVQVLFFAKLQCNAISFAGRAGMQHESKVKGTAGYVSVRCTYNTFAPLAVKQNYHYALRTVFTEFLWSCVSGCFKLEFCNNLGWKMKGRSKSWSFLPVVIL